MSEFYWLGAVYVMIIFVVKSRTQWAQNYCTTQKWQNYMHSDKLQVEWIYLSYTEVTGTGAHLQMSV